MAKRTYRLAIETGDYEGIRLVKAESQAQAIRHIAKGMVHVRVASQDDIISAMTNGTKVEEAGADTEAEGEQA